MAAKHRSFIISKKKKRIFKLILFFLCIIFIITYFDSKIRPLIQTLSNYQSQIYATNAINNAVTNELTKNVAQYESLVKITRNNSGDITSIEADIVNINQLKSNITNAIIEEISILSNQTILIPIGTLLNTPFLSGRGPKINFQIQPSANVNANIYNQFQSSGINQTLHQIMLKVEMTISAVIPGYTTSSVVSTDVCIAETIIVGNIPNSYFDIGTGSSIYTGISKINS